METGEIDPDLRILKVWADGRIKCGTGKQEVYGAAKICSTFI